MMHLLQEAEKRGHQTRHTALKLSNLFTNEEISFCINITNISYQGYSMKK